ncbi:Tail tubular protein Gp11 [uncultured Caudovirales phage]|uniref:Tail tubular protein Gp11 n=1 Tax=uncultured Caudovirales phage TaxID=2100421 RepID=A0A6J5L079_9CAUD|nr:Tail tubular protein Gp11 [uncultured Caudovirales phage]
MSASELDICNRALGLLGAASIVSIDGTEQAADLCRRFLPGLRDELLRNHPWKFATKRALLPASATAPAWGPGYSYPLPTDCLRVLELDAEAGDGWAVEGDAIVTSLTAPLSIRYTARITDTTKWNVSFCSVMAARLAADLAMSLALSASLRSQMLDEMKRGLREARSIDAMEASSASFYADTLVDARRTGVAAGWT